MTDDRQVGLSADARALMTYESSKKSLGLSYVFWLLLGGFGAHRFYLGKSGSAIAIILTNLLGWITLPIGIGAFILVGLGVWLLIDAFLVPGWVSRHNLALMNSLDR